MSVPRYIPVLAVEDDLASSFLAALAGKPQSRVELDHPSGPLTIEAIKFEVVQGEGLASRLSEADAVIIISGNVDAGSIEMLRALHRRLPGDRTLPEAHALHREPGKKEFKISCPTCSQKLWVGDAHEGRPGRCPGCKQTFLIPSQTRHLSACLQLGEDIPVRLHSRGDAASAVGLVNELVARIVARRTEKKDREKNMTMRIVIDGEAGR
jgi:hypothetical protein